MMSVQGKYINHQQAKNQQNNYKEIEQRKFYTTIIIFLNYLRLFG
jgi:hypothetical protein